MPLTSVEAKDSRGDEKRALLRPSARFVAVAIASGTLRLMQKYEYEFECYNNII